jgi:hypothetical protein
MAGHDFDLAAAAAAVAVADFAFAFAAAEKDVAELHAAVGAGCDFAEDKRKKTYLKTTPFRRRQ